VTAPIRPTAPANRPDDRIECLGYFFRIEPQTLHISIPDFTEKVTRPLSIKVRATDATGKRFEVEAEGLLARAICHEMDHLAGKLFTDRLRGLRRERARRMLKRLERDQERGE